MQKKIAILGCGHHARGVAGAIFDRDSEANIVFIDDNARPDEKIMGYPVLKNIPTDVNQFVSGAGDNQKRQKWTVGRKVSTFIARDAVVCKDAIIEEASFIGFGAFVGSETHLGKGCILNTHAVVEHGSKIGEFCNICPNATVLGQCEIGDNVFIGAGSTIKNNATICSNVIVGMGAVVINDITESGTYVGCPAKKIK